MRALPLASLWRFAPGLAELLAVPAPDDDLVALPTCYTKLSRSISRHGMQPD